MPVPTVGDGLLLSHVADLAASLDFRFAQRDPATNGGEAEAESPGSPDDLWRRRAPAHSFWGRVQFAATSAWVRAVTPRDYRVKPRCEGLHEVEPGVEPRGDEDWIVSGSCLAAVRDALSRMRRALAAPLILSRDI